MVVDLPVGLDLWHVPNCFLLDFSFSFVFGFSKCKSLLLCFKLQFISDSVLECFGCWLVGWMDGYVYGFTYKRSL